jgi:hypothetical protein
MVWGTQAARALDPSGATATVEAAAPDEQAAEPVTETVEAAAPAGQAAEPVTETVEAAAPDGRAAEPVTETVEAAAPAGRAAEPVTETVEAAAPDGQAAEPVTETVEAAAPAAQRVVEPVTETVTPVTHVVEDLAPVTHVVEDLAPVTHVVEDLAPVTGLVEDLAPVTGLVEDLAPVTDTVDRTVVALVENTIGLVTGGDTLPALPLPTLSSSPLVPTIGSAFVDPSETGSLQVERSPWQAAHSLLSMTVGEPSSLTSGTFMPDASGSPTDPDVPGPWRAPVELPLVDWGGILETGGRGLSLVAAYLSVAIMLALGISRWIRPIAFARAPNPFLSSIELPG